MTSLSVSPLQADILRWDNGDVIPGTEGIDVGPGAELDNLRLEFANLSRIDLSDASFVNSNLNHAILSGSSLSNANLTDAFIGGARFGGHLSMEQLYATASYKTANLEDVIFTCKPPVGGCVGEGPQADLRRPWDFSGQNLTGASLGSSTLRNADFTDAIVRNALFFSSTRHGFGKEQLYSTASYKEKNLQGIDLQSNDLTGSDFRGQDLTGANSHLPH